MNRTSSKNVTAPVTNMLLASELSGGSSGRANSGNVSEVVKIKYSTVETADQHDARSTFITGRCMF